MGGLGVNRRDRQERHLQLARGVVHALEEEEQSGLEAVVVAEVQHVLFVVQRLSCARGPTLLKDRAGLAVANILWQSILAPASAATAVCD